MSGIQSALIQWLAKATKQSKLKIEDIKSKLVYQLVSQIPKITPIQFNQDNNNSSAWQINYLNFKSIYQAIQNYYRNVLKSPLPVGLASVNLLQISKGQDKQGLLALITIFFIACINSDNKQKYINYVLELDEAQQLQIMALIQEKALTGFQKTQQSSVSEVQEINKNKIDQLYFKIQSLASQNQSLEIQLMAEAEQKLKLKQQIKKLEQQNKKIKRQLDQKTLYISQKQQQQQEQESSQRVLSDSNQQVIKQLKKEILIQQNKHLQYKSQTKQEIQQLKQQLILARDKIVELESQGLMGMSTNKKIHHQDCISVNQHKNITHKLQMKLKILEQKQTQLQRQNLRAKYQYEQLARKCKKQEKEKENLKIQYEKVSATKTMMTVKDAQKIKISILQGISDKLKMKFADTQKKIVQNKIQAN